MASQAEIDELWRLFRENRDQIAALNAFLQKNIEEEARRRAADEQRRAEEEKRRAEEEKRRAEEEKRRAEEEKRRAEELARRDQARAEEEKRRAEELARRDQARAEEEKRRAEELARRDQARAEEEARRAQARAEEEARYRAAREAAHQALDKQIAETNKQIGNLTGKWGRFVEEMVRPAAETIFLDRGIQVHEVTSRMRARRNGESMEIDIYVGNDGEGVVIEVKTTLGEGDVRRFLERLPRFKHFFPRFAGIRLYGAMAGIDIPDQVRDFAINQGLFVLGQSGETVAIRNTRGFQPKAW